MPQTMQVQVKEYDSEGRPVIDPKTGRQRVGIKTVYVSMSWQTADGKQIYLHADGIYGYKDGSPVVSRAELEDPMVIGDPQQRKIALAWWDRKGKTVSKEFYSRQQQIQKKAFENTPGVEREAEADLDQILYARRPTKDKRRAAFGEPFTWFSVFKSRPGWWGADIVEDGQWRYERVSKITHKPVSFEELDEEQEERELEDPSYTLEDGGHDGSLDDVMDQERA